MDAIKNFSKVEVSLGYSSAATTIVLSGGEGVKLPEPSTDGEFNLVWWNSTDYSDPADDPSKEIVRCTARSSDTLTITRAQEDTSSSDKNIASKVYRMVLGITEKIMDDLDTEISGKEPAKGSDDNYVTDAEKVVIGNTSGTNTGDMSDAQVKTAYENNADTNEFSDAEQTKLAGIESGAEANNISDTDATDLTDGGETALHSHAGGAGEANTASNQGAAGVGFFKQKDGVDLEFKNLDAASSKISVTEDVSHNVVNVDVNEANLTVTASQVSDFDTEVANNSAVTANTAKETNATHTGEVTGDGALTIADNIVDEANLKLDEAPTNDYVLTADSAKSGGMKWSAAGSSASPLNTKGDVYTYDTGDARLGVGADGQMLTADSAEATGLKWSTPGGGGDMLKSVYDTDDNGSVDNSQSVVGYVRKGSAGTITIGQPVYISGYNPSDFVEVELADASAAATMPAVGIATESITNAALGKIICLGKLTGIDTSTFSVGDTLYISTTGTLTAAKPTGATDYTQPIGQVLRSHASLGAIKVSCDVDTEGLPNLAEDSIWIGDSDNHAAETPFNAAAIGATITDTEDKFNATTVDTALDEIGETKNWTGYDRQDPDSMPDLAWDGGTRTMSASVKGGQSGFHFWVGGKKITKTTTQSVVIPNTSGSYYTYFDLSGVLQYVEFSATPSDAFYLFAITAMVRWNATQGAGGVGSELHGIRMSAATHKYNHDTFGARYASGMDIEGLEDGEVDYTQTTSGCFWDEDIEHCPTVASTHTFMYRLGAAGEWTTTALDNKIGYKDGADTYYSWNEWTGSTWQLTQGGSSTDYFITFFVATPASDSTKVIKKLIGQGAYANRTDARDAIETEMHRMTMDGLPSPEVVFLYAVIVRRSGELEDLSNGDTYYDLRVLKGGASGGSSSASNAADIATNVTNFNNNLSAADTNVQLALDTVDNLALGIASVAADDTPQLGGDLDVDGSSIVSTSNGDIVLEPDGTGIVKGELKTFMVQLLADDTDQTTGTTIGGDYRISGRAITVKAVRAYVDTAGTTGTSTVDINEAGTSILSTKITIDSTKKSSEDAATPAVISDTAIAADAIITIDQDAIQSTAAKGLKVAIDYIYA